MLTDSHLKEGGTNLGCFPGGGGGAKIEVCVIGLQFKGLVRSPVFGITVTVPFAQSVENFPELIEVIKL